MERNFRRAEGRKQEGFELFLTYMKMISTNGINKHV